jgi:hypothetical protein
VRVTPDRPGLLLLGYSPDSLGTILALSHLTVVLAVRHPSRFAPMAGANRGDRLYCSEFPPSLAVPTSLRIGMAR